MDSFNIKRFAMTARWMARMHFKNVLSFTAGFTCCYLFPCMVVVYPALKYGEAVTGQELQRIVEMSSLVYAIGMILFGTWICADMKTKEQRTQVRLLPATDLEKFLVRFLALTLGVAVVGVVAFFMADLLRVVFSLVAGIDYVRFALPDFMSYVFLNETNPSFLGHTTDTYSAGVYFAALAWCVWAHSLYMLGGTLLRRYQFVITTAVHALLFIIMSVIITGTLGNPGTAFSDPGLTPVFCAAGTLFFVVAVVNWWLTYRLFGRMQVINNKWINL